MKNIRTLHVYRNHVCECICGFICRFHWRKKNEKSERNNFWQFDLCWQINWSIADAYIFSGFTFLQKKEDVSSPRIWQQTAWSISARFIKSFKSTFHFTLHSYAPLLKSGILQRKQKQTLTVCSIFSIAFGWRHSLPFLPISLRFLCVCVCVVAPIFFQIHI